MREHIIKGINTGFILIISSILTLSLLQDNSASLKFIQYFIPILITYIICGIIIQWIRNIPVKNSEGSQGAGIIYWIFLIMIIIPVIGSFIDLYIRYIVLTNIVVIINLIILFVNFSFMIYLPLNNSDTNPKINIMILQYLKLNKLITNIIYKIYIYILLMYNFL